VSLPWRHAAGRPLPCCGHTRGLLVLRFGLGWFTFCALMIWIGSMISALAER
jgi:hypothetical protein